MLHDLWWRSIVLFADSDDVEPGPGEKLRVIRTWPPWLRLVGRTIHHRPDRPQRVILRHPLSGEL